MKSKQVARLVVALVEPDDIDDQSVSSDIDTDIELAPPEVANPDFFPDEEIQVVDPAPEVRVVEKRQLTPPKRISLLPTSQTPSTPSKLVRFGVILESMDERILTSVIRDLLSMVASLPPGERLVVCPASSGDIWAQLAKQMPIDIQYGDFTGVPTWKTYWIDKKPQAPSGVRTTLEERVVSPEAKRLRLRPGTPPPMPTNRDDGWVAPNRDSPEFRRVPTMAPVQMTPQLYLWSSRAPVSGEKVVFPETEEVMTISSIHGSMAKVGPNHVQLDMRGYEFFQPLDVWVTRSFKKEEK